MLRVRRFSSPEIMMFGANVLSGKLWMNPDSMSALIRRKGVFTSRTCRPQRMPTATLEIELISARPRDCMRFSR